MSCPKITSLYLRSAADLGPKRLCFVWISIHWDTVVHPVIPVIYHDSFSMFRFWRYFFTFLIKKIQLHCLSLSEDEKNWLRDSIRFDFKFNILKCISVWAFAKVFTYSRQKQSKSIQHGGKFKLPNIPGCKKIHR